MSSIEIDRVKNWVEEAVLGLGLCPFAGEHWNAGRVRLTVSNAESEDQLLLDLHDEMKMLAAADPNELETTLLVVRNILQAFSDYNQFLDQADDLVQQNEWLGVFQIASFHPDYQFAGTRADDPSNLTNRSPYPVLHVLRESTVSQALAEYSDPEQIPETNIATLQALSLKRRQEIFRPRPN